MKRMLVGRYFMSKYTTRVGGKGKRVMESNLVAFLWTKLMYFIWMIMQINDSFCWSYYTIKTWANGWILMTLKKKKKTFPVWSLLMYWNQESLTLCQEDVRKLIHSLFLWFFYFSPYLPWALLICCCVYC